MKLQLGWLREHVDLPESAREVADRLTAAGLTVDGVEGEGDAATFDVDVTSNRVDATCHVGVARELAAAFGRSLRVPVPAVPESGEPASSTTSVTVEAPDLCPRYAARVVRGVTVGPGPSWMSARLAACGIRPINVVVDVTNHVLLELGHPLHAFDLDLLGGRRIVVRRARPGERMTTLDGQDRALADDVLLIADDSRGVAVAGVMGGADSEIRDATRDVLLESAWFEPRSVRRTARRLGLHTEASYRFERGADVDAVPLALDRAAQLLAELAGGQVAPGLIDVAQPLPERPVIALRRERLRRLTGVDVPPDSVVRILRALGFDVVSGDDAAWQVRPPRRRLDVTREEDLIEEVLRHHGYDRVPATLPPFREGAQPRTPAEQAMAEMRRSLVASGLHQAISWSFGDPAQLEPWRASLAADGPARVLRLDNPLAENLSEMRTSLVPGLLAALSRSVRRGEEDVRLWEDGRIFLERPSGQAGESPAEERTALAIVETGRRGPRHFQHRPAEVDVLALTGTLLDALATLSGRRRDPRLEVVAAPAPNCAPGGAELRFEGSRVGWIGRVHPDLTRPMEVDAPVLAAEVDLTALLPREPPRPAFEPLSRYPRVVRDASVLVDRNRPYGAIIAAIREFREARDPAADASSIESVDLVDRWTGKGVPEDKVSLTFSVSYRRHDRTLTQDEVDRLHGRLVGLLADRFGATLRT